MTNCCAGLSCEPVKEERENITYLCDVIDEVINLKNRIEALHEHKLRQIDENKKISGRMDEIERYKSLIDSLNGNRNDWMNGFNECLNQIRDLEILFYDEKEKFRCNDKKPHKCPVCDGKGHYYHLFESQSVPTLLKCNACTGKGIVWS